MLANLNVVICGIMLSAALFVATGNGIIVPAHYTYAGKAPQVGRAEAHVVVTDEPARALVDIAPVDIAPVDAAPVDAVTAKDRDLESVQPHEQAAMAVFEPAAEAHENAQSSAQTVTPGDSVPQATAQASLAEPRPAAGPAGEVRADAAGAPTQAADNATPPRTEAAPSQKEAAPPQKEAALPRQEEEIAVTPPAPTDATVSEPVVPSAAGSGTAPDTDVSILTNHEPPASKAPDDAAAADHDTTDTTTASTSPALAAHASVRLRRVRPAARAVAAAPRKPVVRHARARVPLPTPSPVGLAPSPSAGASAATPAAGLLGQANFVAPSHQ